MRFMDCMYNRHTMLSSKFRIPAENKSRVAGDTRKWKSKTNRSAIQVGGPWSSLATAGLGARGGGPGVPKGRPGDRPGPVSTQEILVNLTFAARAARVRYRNGGPYALR
jgi:hypothetical protein